MMIIIVVGGIKGDSGKTTIATNLAVMRSAEQRSAREALLSGITAYLGALGDDDEEEES
jgi:hypothetical protein